ncbi:pyrroloquinoline quinone biosynthesis protein PqqB [Rubripirellula obstinata]|uniref:Pyrroloquinoline quinone biosynthesis protein PqqB n=1 Tax=Rubripirellula obstinata TaxID=406547 RepID=A0A5B1CG59_9BACT|nr:MBL fold metallo-hydrolase [Rubripirellula obstinata]KAA1258560.1 pyrroloquinoline quinone biosynthesis protein PqqB [Rubripirellula obstinata]
MTEQFNRTVVQMVNLVGFVVFAVSCHCTAFAQSPVTAAESPFVIVLGIAQDAGYPQAGCRKPCCAKAWNEPSLRRHASCLAIVDPISSQRWLIECTPDFREQFHQLDAIVPPKRGLGIDGVFLTHAHIGHYTGLMHLGREVIGAGAISVFAMPRMKHFLESNGPWSQLVSANNIKIHELLESRPERISERVRVTPILVPHRDEYSETVGFRIEGPNRTAIFLPDIDKWERWEMKIEDVLRSCDVAYLDGTFFGNGELPGRDMSTIPHPFIENSIKRFSSLPDDQRSKVRFLHFNHTNPVLDPKSDAAKTVRQAGHHLAVENERFEL